ncbi:MAG: hypothetical protein LUE99_07020 [Bacteroides sp.]|nr:hypothetical protein [Bacteroides sp.]
MKKISPLSLPVRHPAGALLLLLAAALPLMGCIHQYPEAGAYTPVTVTFEVETDTSLPLYQSVTRTAPPPTN